MAATVTLTKGPSAIAAGFKMATYSVALDTAHATGGEAIDISNEFEEVFYADCGANDTAADNYHKFDVIHPGAGTAVTTTNVLITACWSSTTAKAFTEITGDLTAVGELQVLVIGQ